MRIRIRKYGRQEASYRTNTDKAVNTNGRHDLTRTAADKLYI